MKISLEGAAQVKIVPETQEEREGLETLWMVLVQGNERNVLAPLGTYHVDDEGATFVVKDPAATTEG